MFLYIFSKQVRMYTKIINKNNKQASKYTNKRTQQNYFTNKYQRQPSIKKIANKSKRKRTHKNTQRNKHFNTNVDSKHSPRTGKQTPAKSNVLMETKDSGKKTSTQPSNH